MMLHPTGENQSEWLGHVKAASKGADSVDQVQGALLQDVLRRGVALLGTGDHQGGQSSYAPPPCFSVHPPVNMPPGFKKCGWGWE